MMTPGFKIPPEEAMKHGSLTPLPLLLRAVPHMGGIVAAALLLALSPPAFAGIFSATKNDVAMKVAELRSQDRDAIVFGLDFSPDGSRLAEDSQSSTINIWDWRNNRIDKSISAPQGFNPTQVENGLLYNPDGQLLAICAGRGVGDVFVRLWNTDNWSVAKDITDSGAGGCDGISFSPNGRMLVRIVDRAGLPGDNIIVHSEGSWQPSWGLALERFRPVSVAVSPDGELAAIGAVLTVIQLQQITHELKIYFLNLHQQKVVRVIPTKAAGPLSWSPDGKRIAATGNAGDVAIHNADSGHEIVSAHYEHGTHMNNRYTQDGRYFIECDMNGRGSGLGIRIWDSQRSTLLQQIPGNIGTIAVSRDGKYLAVGLEGRTTIWQFK
jgi:WD40 repeat protein